ncbi:MAG: cob(I)yrinic acid a,c-diamide adenosyltransferase [Sedimenticolaceae bacterium]|nr:cob(I)yrinic acid a,c-diamide adenosyltransferase [Sedimenticolaceae bacterium]
MAKSSIYTRTGDQGTTGLANGERIGKASLRVSALGSVDELNAAIGLALALAPDDLNDSINGCLLTIQNRLFIVGAMLAQANGMQLPDDAITSLEADIDRFDAQLAPLRHFILPGGSPAGAQLHIARTICRRAERDLLTLGTSDKVESVLSIYLNRLSDLLFVLARLVNQHAGIEEQAWKP